LATAWTATWAKVSGGAPFAPALLAVPVAASAQSGRALDFPRSIYEPYKQAAFKGQPYRKARRFFVTDLAEAIERDFEKARNLPLPAQHRAI
jgi:hypothetical protein